MHTEVILNKYKESDSGTELYITIPNKQLSEMFVSKCIKKAEGKGKGRKEGDARNRKKASTRGTAVGAKRGRTKGNEQEAKYRKPEKKQGKPSGREGGKQGSREEVLSAEEAAVRQNQEEEGTEETEAE